MPFVPLSASPDATNTPPLELWGGIECTINRVGDHWFDQSERSGHARRLDDLDLIAGLGLRTLRYPVLWERVAPHGDLSRADWSWPDERLGRLRDLDIRPVAGLVHHGSGPVGTDLLDPAFPEKVAEYARAVACRYPWLEDYTPINEPLTTARFTGLYGHWYPHGRDERTFQATLLNECRATVLAMRAIRQINPRARLIQTEDLGKTWSTPALADQAAFENERRWITWDLLCGRVSGPHHRMWHHLRWAGFSESEIAWFVENPCPPDVLGINHYLTSERFLDERTERYPADTHGANHSQIYADVEAVRVLDNPGPAGVRGLLNEAWERFHLPLAITEAHLGCTREEQARWLLDVWRAARDAREHDGCDVRAVTVWSLLGAYDWNSLLTRNAGHYEPGVFDLRTPNGRPRPTIIAGLVRDLAAGREPSHPVLAVPGWWQRPERLIFEPVSLDSSAGPHPLPLPRGGRGVPGTKPASASREVLEPSVAGTPLPPRGRGRGWGPARPVLIFGDGALAQTLLRQCALRGLPHYLVSPHNSDADAGAVERVLNEERPWAVIYAAGWESASAAEADPYQCLRANVQAPATLAAACARRPGVRLLVFSSARVFDGGSEATQPLVESDPVRPASVLGRSHAEAETQVAKLLPNALVIRTGMLFGPPWHDDDWLVGALRVLAAGQTLAEDNDLAITPAYVHDIVHVGLDLLLDGESGVWHLFNPGAPLTRAGLVRRAAELAGLDASLVRDVSLGDVRRVALDSEHWVNAVAPFDHALERFVSDGRPLWALPAPNVKTARSTGYKRGGSSAGSGAHQRPRAKAHPVSVTHSVTHEP